MTGQNPTGAYLTGHPTTGQAFAPGQEPAAATPETTSITVSRGFNVWLRSHDTSLAFTSYQLFLVGSHLNGTVSFNQQNFQRAMGVCWMPERLYLGSLFQLWQLENMLRLGKIANQAFDSVLVQRNAQTTGDVELPF